MPRHENKREREKLRTEELERDQTGESKRGRAGELNQGYVNHTEVEGERFGTNTGVREVEPARQQQAKHARQSS